ncbi:hypothetical protein KAU34_01565 [candidate division WOR-3 bacterium]|nr:hypothetical protein [candidate division WOR-3 bacterium]
MLPLWVIEKSVRFFSLRGRNGCVTSKMYGSPLKGEVLISEIFLRAGSN